MKRQLRTFFVLFMVSLCGGCAEEHITEECTISKTDLPKVKKAIEELNQFIHTIDNGCPVFLAAVSGAVNGHAWVIDGYKKYTRYVNSVQENRYYMHCCWGWPRGRCNGYYLSKVFDLRNGAIELSHKDTPGTKDCDFDVLYRMVTYDKPVK